MYRSTPDKSVRKGKLTVLALATASALASMSTVHASNTVNIGQTVSGTQVWASGDFLVNATGVIDAGGAVAITVSGAQGTLLNNGTIQNSRTGLNNSSGTIAGVINNGTIYSQTYGIYNGTGTIASITNGVNAIIDGSTAIYNGYGTIGSIVNSGTIGTIFSGNGITNQYGTIDAIINTTGSTIAGGLYGIENYAGTIGTISNSGTIYGAALGIYNVNGVIGSLSNSGTINSVLNSALIKSSVTAINNSGTIGDLINTGTIYSTSGRGINNNAGTIGQISNSKTIYGSLAAIVNAVGTIGSIDNTVLIDGGNTGISNLSGLISTITNQGTITGGGSAIYNSAGTIGSITNSGIIRGSYGIKNTSVIGGLSNSGLIQGSVYAIYSSDTLGSISNTGTIAGAIWNNSSNALTIAGGSGTVVGTLTGYSGNISSTNIGSIISNANLSFSGNQLLNDNISLTAGSITNTGNLQVNNVLTITGNYEQGSGSSLIIGVSSGATIASADVTDSGYGRLQVTGSVNLDNSNITLKDLGYGFARGQRYVVVAATAGISTTDTTYTAAGYTVTGTVVSDNSTSTFYSDLVLQLSDSSGSTSVVNNATTRNAITTLDGLFSYSGNNASLLAVFNPAAALGSAGAANSAGAQLSPAAISSAVSNAVDSGSQAVGNVLTSHMDDTRQAFNGTGSSGLATGERASDIALWGQFFGGRAAQSTRDDISGYHGTYRGLLLGADTATSDVARVGGLFSAARTNVGGDSVNTGSSASVNSYGVSAYASYDGQPWYVNLMAGAAHQQYSTARAISYTGFSGVANGSFNGNQYMTAVQAGYPLNLEHWLPGATLTPLAGLRYSTLRQNGYTESGGNGAALTVQSSTSDSFKSELGAKLESSLDTSCGKLLPSLQLGWRHEFRDKATQTAASFAADTTGSTGFVTQNASPVANTAVLSLGATLLKTSSLSLSARYTLEAGGGYLGQTGSVQVRWQY